MKDELKLKMARDCENEFLGRMLRHEDDKPTETSEQEAKKSMKVKTDVKAVAMAGSGSSTDPQVASSSVAPASSGAPAGKHESPRSGGERGQEDARRTSREARRGEV